MIQSVERAFRLLYAIGRYEGHIKLSQLARDVDLPRTTVVRLLETLHKVGAVKSAGNDLGQGEYLLGEQLLSLLSTTSWQDQLSAIAQPILQKLAERTGETVYFCLPDGDQTLFTSQINCRYKIQMSDSTGHRHPMHLTSAGKLFLAYRSIEEQEKYLTQKLESYTDFSQVSAKVLRQQFKQALQTGIGWTRDEYEIGYIGIAAPIFNQRGELVASPSIGAPKFRIQGKDHEEEYAQMVRETAQIITNRLSRI
jgi:DNA-binding IclR family transcriptional regulator